MSNVPPPATDEPSAGRSLSNVSDPVARVIADAAKRGLRIDVSETAGSRTAEEAARAVGTTVARIVKSLVFRGRDSGRPYLLLVSGANRVDEALMSEHLGELVERADADFVRARTGFAIGGVSPFGCLEDISTFMDESLFGHPAVWVAAGTPRHMFEIAPLQLRSALAAQISRVW